MATKRNVARSGDTKKSTPRASKKRSIKAARPAISPAFTTTLGLYTTTPDGRLRGELVDRTTRRSLFTFTGSETFARGGIEQIARAWEETSESKAVQP